MKYQKKISEILTIAVNQINKIDEAAMSLKPAPDKWSKREILGHLIDSAYNNHQRFIKANAQDHLIFEGYDQDEWVKRNNYQNRTTPEVVDLWLTTNFHLSFMIKNLPETLLNKKTTQHHFHKMCMQLIPEGESSNLSYLIWDYIYHMEYHLKQIIPNYKELNEPFICSSLVEMFLLSLR